MDSQMMPAAGVLACPGCRHCWVVPPVNPQWTIAEATVNYSAEMSAIQESIEELL